MRSCRPPAPLGLAVLLVAAASCLALLDGGAAPGDEADCINHRSCDSCLNSTLNSSCIWLQCKEESQSRCKNQTNEQENCTVYKGQEQCLVTPINGTTSAPPGNITTIPIPGNATHTSSPKVTTTTANATVTTTPGTQPSRKSTFDASSFIGGIVLVLGLQAVIFFLYKFCKSKDQNYHTL
ncbi:sialomucin core protein 24 [Paroedura picta]|uniref:sialomucin core protein 24 n=1 Tax=Paroedura picta TaxID=143630 RepID=UPI00405664EB